jgi:carbon storage regulator
MLALTRRVGEEIVIGDPRQPLGIIRVVEIHGDKVRLSFDFPRTTAINRKELADLKAQHAPGAPEASAGDPPRPAGPPSHAPGPG